MPMDARATCQRKRRYRTRWAAVLAEFSAEARTGDDHEVYRCRHCGNWHIGHARRTYAPHPKVLAPVRDKPRLRGPG